MMQSDNPFSNGQTQAARLAAIAVVLALIKAIKSPR